MRHPQTERDPRNLQGINAYETKDPARVAKTCSKSYSRQSSSPDDRSPDLLTVERNPLPLSRRGPYLRIAKAASHTAHPPLGKPVHRRIVQSHIRIDPPDLPALGPQPMAKLGLLTGYQAIAKSADCPERVGANQRVSTACLCLTNWRVPLYVAKLVVG